jgi:hypothetical protein
VKRESDQGGRLRTVSFVDSLLLKVKEVERFVRVISGASELWVQDTRSRLVLRIRHQQLGSFIIPHHLR